LWRDAKLRARTGIGKIGLPMMSFDLRRKLVAEAIGPAALVAAVVGSGIMAEGLTPDRALALLCNTLPTGAILVVIIAVLGPVSGAHFNPVVSLVLALKGEMKLSHAFLYIVSQITGALAGVMLSHLMFALPPLSESLKVRTGSGQWLAEVVATFGLVVVILAGTRFRQATLPWLVGLYITAAYWFTASTSFANPAVVIARSLTNTFSGIRPVDAPAFIVAELIGALAGLMLMNWLLATAPAPGRYGSEVAP